MRATTPWFTLLGVALLAALLLACGENQTSPSSSGAAGRVSGDDSGAAGSRALFDSGLAGGGNNGEGDASVVPGGGRGSSAGATAADSGVNTVDAGAGNGGAGDMPHLGADIPNVSIAIEVRSSEDLQRAANDPDVGMVLVTQTTEALDFAPLAKSNIVRALDANYPSWNALYPDLAVVRGLAPGKLSGLAAEAQSVVGKATLPHKNRFLALHELGDLSRALAPYPKFFEHFDGLQLDYEYLVKRDDEQCKRDESWLKAHNLSVIVTAAYDCNGWPGLSFIDWGAEDKAHSSYGRTQVVFSALLRKMQLLGAKVLVVQAHDGGDVVPGLTWLQGEAMAAGVELSLRVNAWNSGATRTSVNALVAAIPGTKVAVDSGLSGANPFDMTPLGVVVLAGSGVALRNAVTSSTRATSFIRAPLTVSSPSLTNLPGDAVIRVLDGDYKTWDEIQGDLNYVGW